MAKSEHRVFISFVHEDQFVAAAVKSMLSKEPGLQGAVFLSADKATILGGDQWLEKVRDALNSSTVLVLMLSRRALGRPWVNFEAGAAWLTNKKIIPCCFGRMKKGLLPQPYAGFQAIDLPTEAHYLLKSVHKHLGLEGPVPPKGFARWLAKELYPPKKVDAATSGMLGETFEALSSAIKRYRDTPLAKR